MLRVGQKVVCVFRFRLQGHEAETGVTIPRPGGLYHIRALDNVGLPRRLALMVEEIINPMVELDTGEIDEPWFTVRAFRPVIERKTGIAIFERMLNRSPERV